MEKKPFSFKVKSQVGQARAGELQTPHGLIETPIFMPVGTQGSVKALSSEDLHILGAQIILSNAYHLYLRPGTKVIKEMGGLHQMMKWKHPILTDSGGYQVSSLGLFKADSSKSLSRIDEEGVTFKSHLDGSTHRFTPEKAIDIQEIIGADIIMAFDEATPTKGKDYAQKAMERTHKWLKLCQARWQQKEALKTDKGRGLPQALFGIIQGGDYQDLRQESAEFVTSLDLPGIALGGDSVGQSEGQTSQNVDYVRSYLPKNKPLYLMGVGTSPQAAVSAIIAGADMFDCVAPTRLARCGLLFTGKLVIGKSSSHLPKFESEDQNGRINIDQSRYAVDHKVIEPSCDCFTCQAGYSRAYLHHLYRAKELLFYRLASIHNLRMMIKTVNLMRAYIFKGVGVYGSQG
jgi:queuine tRNA-ribosyltransferase